MPDADRDAEGIQDTLRHAFETNYESLLKLSYLYSGRWEMAEDLAQEAFVRAAPKISGIPTAEVPLYLRRTLINLWKNRMRRAAVERRARARVQWLTEVVTPITEPDLTLWNAVRSLPPRQRACVILRFHEDLSEQQVAKTLGCSVGTVKSSTSRALAKLRMELRNAN